MRPRIEGSTETMKKKLTTIKEKHEAGDYTLSELLKVHKPPDGIVTGSALPIVFGRNGTRANFVRRNGSRRNGIRRKINSGCKYQTQNIQILKKQDISKLSGVHE